MANLIQRIRNFYRVGKELSEEEQRILGRVHIDIDDILLGNLRILAVKKLGISRQLEDSNPLEKLSFYTGRRIPYLTGRL